MLVSAERTSHFLNHSFPPSIPCAREQTTDKPCSKESSPTALSRLPFSLKWLKNKKRIQQTAAPTLGAWDCATCSDDLILLHFDSNPFSRCCAPRHRYGTIVIGLVSPIAGDRSAKFLQATSMGVERESRARSTGAKVVIRLQKSYQRGLRSLPWHYFPTSSRPIERTNAKHILTEQKTKKRIPPTKAKEIAYSTVLFFVYFQICSQRYRSTWTPLNTLLLRKTQLCIDVFSSLGWGKKRFNDLSFLYSIFAIHNIAVFTKCLHSTDFGTRNHHNQCGYVEKYSDDSEKWNTIFR